MLQPAVLRFGENNVIGGVIGIRELPAYVVIFGAASEPGQTIRRGFGDPVGLSHQQGEVSGRGVTMRINFQRTSERHLRLAEVINFPQVISPIVVVASGGDAVALAAFQRSFRFLRPILGD